MNRKCDLFIIRPFEARRGMGVVGMEYISGFGGLVSCSLIKTW